MTSMPNSQIRTRVTAMVMRAMSLMVSAIS